MYALRIRSGLNRITLYNLQDSDAFSSSPQLGGRFNRRGEGHERAGLTGLRNIGNTVIYIQTIHFYAFYKLELNFILLNFSVS